MREKGKGNEKEGKEGVVGMTRWDDAFKFHFPFFPFSTVHSFRT